MPEMNITEWDILTEDDVKNMQFDSGVIITDFDPESFTAPTDLLFATTGDIGINYQPTVENLGSDVNNIHQDYAELAVITGVATANITVTVLNFDTATLKLALGAADVSGNKVSPRIYLKATDFTSNLAWVGKKIGGGLVAVVIPKALCTSGLAFSAKKGGKGTTSLTIQAFATLADKEKAQMEFYSTQSAS